MSSPASGNRAPRDPLPELEGQRDKAMHLARQLRQQAQGSRMLAQEYDAEAFRHEERVRALGQAIQDAKAGGRWPGRRPDRAS